MQVDALLRALCRRRTVTRPISPVRPISSIRPVKRAPGVPQVRKLLLVPAFIFTVCLLAGCSEGIMPEAAARATATACNCGCFPYGSRQYSVSSATPTPTGTWRPPTSTLTRTPTRPAGGSYSTMLPVQPTYPPAWPPPAVTCTAAPDQPTLPPRPTVPPPVFPTEPVNTPMPSRGSGSTLGRALASMSGNAGMGQPYVSSVEGAPVFAWSQDNTDQATDAEHRVYVRRMDPATRTMESAVAVNKLESKKGFKATYMDSAVAVTPDGVTHVLYCDKRAGESPSGLTGLTDALYTSSQNGDWAPPLRLGAPSMTWCNNVRLHAAPDGALFAVWAGGDPDQSAMPDSFLRVLRRSPQGEWSDISPPRMTSGRQFEGEISFLDLTGEAPGAYRTFLAFDDGHNAYVTWSDSRDAGGGQEQQGREGWPGWHAPVEVANSDRMNRALGILDYWPSSLRMLSFWYGERAYTYVFWSLYSTGRLSYVYSSNAADPGGPRYTGEDALAYFPPTAQDPEPVETPGETGHAEPGETRSEAAGEAAGDVAAESAGATWRDDEQGSTDDRALSRTYGASMSPKVHMPQPFWVPERSRILVVYRYGTSPAYEGAPRRYFAAYAYSLPDAPGSAWQGSVGAVGAVGSVGSSGSSFSQSEPLRAFPPTTYEAMDQLQGAGALDSTGAAWLGWMERGAGKEAYFGAIWPYTLISANNRP